MFKEQIKMALNSLWCNKMRALLTMLGIIIGIGAVIAIMTVGNSLTNSVKDSMTSMGASNITVNLKSRESETEINKNGAIFEKSHGNSTLDNSDYITTEMISNLYNQYKNNIKAISLTDDAGTGVITNGRDSSSVNVNGVSAGYFLSNELDFIGGSYFSNEEFDNGSSSIIVSDTMVDDVYNKEYKKVLGKQIDVKINGAYHTYTITGVYKSDNSDSMSAMAQSSKTTAYIPLKSANKITKTSGYSTFTIVTTGNIETEKFVSQIKDFMNGYYRNNHNFEVTTYSMESMLDIMTSMMSNITTAISVIAGIALLVGGIGVMNIMLVSVTERTREIGTRKAIGATNSSIRIQFIVEAVVICLIGGILGVILGIVLGYAGTSLLGYPANTSISSIIFSLSFSMAIGVFFGYYPANKAAKLNPIEALRYE